MLNCLRSDDERLYEARQCRLEPRDKAGSMDNLLDMAIVDSEPLTQSDDSGSDAGNKSNKLVIALPLLLFCRIRGNQKLVKIYS